MKQARLDELDLEPRVRSALASLLRRLDEATWSRIDRIILYGSVARGESHAQSDVDLLVVWNGTEHEGMDRLGRPTTEVLLETGIDIAVQIVVPEDFTRIKEAQSPFFRNVAREGIIVES